ncbi:hypothetical protein ACNF49_03330 [Actinomadura sp. ATCC 39365]
MDEDVLSRWRGRSMAEGWSLADDWWTPAVAYAIRAATDGGDLPRACEELGAARAGAGVGINEGLGDLAALFAVTDRGEPTFPLVRAYAAGWAEQSFAPMSDLQCEDPLTGLATVAYLRTRLGELYRGRSRAGTCWWWPSRTGRSRSWPSGWRRRSTWPRRCAGRSPARRHWHCSRPPASPR